MRSGEARVKCQSPIKGNAGPLICPSAHRLLSRARDPPSSMKTGRRRKWLGVKTGAELEQDWGPSLADQHLQPLRCPEPELISARWATRDGGMLRVTSSAKSPPGRSATVCGGAAEACDGACESATPSQPRLDAPASRRQRASFRSFLPAGPFVYICRPGPGCGPDTLIVTHFNPSFCVSTPFALSGHQVPPAAPYLSLVLSRDSYPVILF